jgi:glucose dehydrogenase
MPRTIRIPTFDEGGRPRTSRARISTPVTCVLALLLVASGCSDTQKSPPIDADFPPEVREFAADWPLPGRDYRNSRATTDSSIDSSTVGRLEPAWHVALPGVGGYGNAATTPLIAGDTVYVEDLSSNVHALDLATGAVRWERKYASFVIGPNGVALGWGKVFAIKGLQEVVALDARTGDELWSRSIVGTPTEGIDIQPTVFAGLVLASTVPVSLNGIYTGGDHGVLQALDQETGEVKWSFDTVADDLWGNPSVNSGGGAWYPPAIDPRRGRVYWGIANPAPFPGIREFPNGTSRPGPNLYTESVVALDVHTGNLQWYRQAIPHDLFDRDLVHALIVDARIEGKSRTVVAGTGKLGRVIGHDADTGDVLWDTPVGKHQNDELEALTGATDLLPGTFGGVLTPPAAEGGVVYVAVLNAPSTLFPDRPAYFASNIGTMPGDVVAIDAGTGRILWDVEVDGDPLGGATVVNDLVLTATLQGTILALDRATGAEVWRHAAPGGINGWPAVAGDTIVWPIGLSSPAELLALRVGG